MKKALNGISLSCMGIGAVLTIIILFLRSPDLFTALIVVSSIGLIISSTMFVAEKDRVLRKAKTRNIANRITGIMSQLLTAIVAIIFDTPAAIFVPLLLLAVILPVRWLVRKVMRAWRHAWWRNRSLQR